MRSTTFLLAVLLLLTTIPLAQSGEVRTITLENGLDVVMIPDASSPLLSSLVIVQTGSAYEDLSTAGATHMLEHMMFRGTETRTQGEIYDAMDRMGAYYNAQTSKTYTNYILVVPGEHATKAMAIQADMVLHSTVPADTYDVEKGRVIAELQQSHNRSSYPAEVAHLHHVYEDTPYGFPTLGSVSGVTALSRDKVKAFHDAWYAPNNITLVLRGDLTFAEMEALARETYGHEPAQKLPERPESWPVGLENWRAGNTFYTYGDVNSGTIHLTIPAPVYDSPDYPAFQLLKSALDEALEEKLRGPGMPRITYVYTSTTVDPRFSVLTVQAGLIPGRDAQSVVDDILAAIRSVAEREFSQGELSRTHDRMLREELFFSEQVQYGSFLLVPKLAVAPYAFWEETEAHRADVGPQEAAEVARRWFAEPFYVASAYLPRSDESESAGIVMGDVEATFIPANGMAVYARQVKGAPVAGIHIVAKNRALLEGTDKRGWADLLHRLLLTAYDAIDSDSLARLFDEIGMDVSTVDDPRVPFDNYRTSPEYSYVRVEVVADRWPAALAMMGRLFEKLDPDEDAVGEAVTELEGIIGDGDDKVSTAASRLFKEKLFGEHPLAGGVYGDGSSLETVTSSRLDRFASTYFAGNNLMLGVVSPAPPEEVFQVATDAFDRLPETDVNVTAPDPTARQGEYEVTGSGRQGYLATGFLLPEPPDEHRAALIVANAMVSDLIYRDLGEKKGWAYGAGSSLYLRPGWGAWTAGMGLPDEHLQTAETAIYQHLQRIAEGDFDEERFEVARQSVLGKTLRRYSSRINLAMALSVDAFYWADPLDTWTLYEKIRQVTMDEVEQAAKAFLAKPDGKVTVYGHPEASGEENTGMPPGMMRGMDQ